MLSSATMSWKENAGMPGDLRGIWAVAWRAVLYLPLMLAAFLLSMALAILPVVILSQVLAGILSHAWHTLVPAVFEAAIWLFLLWVWQRWPLGGDQDLRSSL
jgi:hypothetical protein